MHFRAYMAVERSSIARGFIQELDGLRGIAILLVMVHRFWPRTATGVAAELAGAGWIGVDLFFVISGFLITGILLDTRSDEGYFKNFYARRALRIFPLYYLFVIGVFAVFWSNAAFREHAGSPLWYLFHLGNVPEGVLGNDVPYWLAPVWSLAIEEQFYLTFPWLVFFLDRRKLTIALALMILVAPAIRYATMLADPEHERLQYQLTLCRIDTLAAGCLLAVIARSVDVTRWRHHATWMFLLATPAILVLAIASHLDRTSPFDRVLGYSVVAIGAGIVVGLVVLYRGERITAPLRFRPLTYLGKLCFGLYLLHRPADTLVSAVADRLDIDAAIRIMPLKLAVAVGLATVSWRVLERPLLALKDRFATSRHPSASPTEARGTPGLVRRTLRRLGLISLLVVPVLGGCKESPGASPDALLGDAPIADDARRSDAPADAPRDAATDAATDAAIDAAVDAAIDAAVPDAPPDAPPLDAGPLPPPSTTVLYPRDTRHSPLPPALALRLQTIAATSAQAEDVFAKVGDSITVADEFLDCFATNQVELGAHAALAPTLAYFLAGNAAGTSPFARTSFAASSGKTASWAVQGTPSPLDRELTLLAPRIAVVLFGTNDTRLGRPLDEFGRSLWTIVDESLARGVIPILSTIPPNTGYPVADARIPLFNDAVRAIAQGRGVPLVDLHHALTPLPNRGISQDGIHPSAYPAGACKLTSAGLQYGYNVRNLLTLEALARTRAALTGSAPDANASTREGTGSIADPIRATLPVSDLGTTRDADAVLDGCGAGPTTGHAVVYRLDLLAPAILDAHVIDRGSTDVDVHVYAGSLAASGCVATGASQVSTPVGAGPIFVVVSGHTAPGDGEYLLIVRAR